MFFLCTHPLVMIVAYDFWANYHVLLLTHSISMLLLGASCWALPDPKYEYWLRGRLWLFYLFALINVALALVGAAGGIYFYNVGPALYSFLGVAVLSYVVIGMGPMLAMVVISFVLV